MNVENLVEKDCALRPRPKMAGSLLLFVPFRPDYFQIAGRHRMPGDLNTLTVVIIV